jgi:hypothetical protein
MMNVVYLAFFVANLAMFLIFGSTYLFKYNANLTLEPILVVVFAAHCVFFARGAYRAVQAWFVGEEEIAPL